MRARISSRLGAVLYEMLAGRRAFQRDTAAETMTAILREDPPALVDVRADVAPALGRIVQHCLEKNPAERFQTAPDVAFALENLAGSGSAVSERTAPVDVDTRRRSARRAGIAVAAALLAIAAFALGRWLAPGRSTADLLFQVVTNQPQTIFNARFMPDGETVVISSAPEGLTPSLSIVRPGSSQQQPFGPAAVHLLAVSATGELAVLTEADHVSERVFMGTLSRMTLDGAPRSVLQNVREADWAPDGSLAIIRDNGGRDVLEYPIGTRLIESGGYLSDLRVSPDGGRVAFFRHQVRFDDRGWVEVVDRKGAVTRLTEELIGLQGLAWSRDGATVLFSGSAAAEEFPYLPKVVSAAGGAIRPAWASPGNMFIQDVAPDGEVLATREDHAARIGAKAGGHSAERDLTWIASSWAPFLSHDGRVVVFTEGATTSARENYALLMRPTDGGPASEIGEGHAQGVSPDGRWAASLLPSTQRLMLYPLGPGAPVSIERGEIREYGLWSVQWFPDSRHVFFRAATGDRWDYFRQAIGGAPGRLPALAGLERAHLNRAGNAVLGRPANGDWRVVPLDGGNSQIVRGLSRTDSLFDWSSDGKSVFAQRGPGRFERIDLTSGRALQSFTFGPSNRTGVSFMSATSLIDDGAGYAYSYYQRLSRAFRVTGVLR